MGLIFYLDWSVRGDDTIILDIIKASEVGQGLTMPRDHTRASLNLMSELLDFLFVAPPRVSSFYFFLFFILVDILSMPNVH